MIEVYTLYKNGQGYWKTNVTEAVKSISISGSKDQVARKLDATFFYSIFDKNYRNTQIGPGTKMWVTYNRQEIFRGIVWERELNSKQELVVTTYDYLIYLLQSTVTYNFKNILAEEAIKKIITDLGLKYNSIPSTGIRVSRLIQDKTAYEAIMEILTQVSKQNGRQYIPVCNGTIINIIEKGTIVTNYELQCISRDSEYGNILDVSYKDSMANMVGRVKIYDDKGNYIGKVDDPNQFDYYGILQKTYQKEKDKNEYTVAKNMLHWLDKEVTIEAIGNWSCRTGYAINTKIFFIDSLKNRKMYIDGDTHTWNIVNKKYTMSLNLKYENSMDRKEG